LGDGQILIIDSGSQTRWNVRFLLYLAGYGSTVVLNGAEAVNWTVSRDPEASPYALLLINDLPGRKSWRTVARSFRQLKISMPILVVVREGDCDSLQQEFAEAGDLHAGWCFPEDLLENVRALCDRRQETEKRTGTEGD